MEIFIALLPVLCAFLFIAFIGALIRGLALAHWLPVYVLFMIECMWGCQMVFDKLSDRSFQLLFVASIAVAFVIFFSVRYMCGQADLPPAEAARNRGDPPPTPVPPVPPVAQTPHPARDAVPVVVQTVLLEPGDRSVKIQISISKDQP